MHTILTDFGRSTREITDAEWDIRSVSPRGEAHWTNAAAWGDFLASTHRMRHDMLRNGNRVWYQPTEAADLFVAARNEQRVLQARVCQART